MQSRINSANRDEIMDKRNSPFIPFQPLAEFVIVGYKMTYLKSRTVEHGFLAIASISTVQLAWECLYTVQGFMLLLQNNQFLHAYSRTQRPPNIQFNNQSNPYNEPQYRKYSISN